MMTYVEHVQTLIETNLWDAHLHRYFRNGDITIYGHTEKNPLTNSDEYFTLQYRKGWFGTTVSLSRNQYGDLVDDCGRRDIRKYPISLSSNESELFLNLLPIIVLTMQERAEEKAKKEKVKVAARRVWP